MLEGFHALKHAVRFGAEIQLAVATDPAAVDELARTLAPDVRSAVEGIVRRVDPDIVALAAPRVPRTGVVAFARRPTVDAGALLGRTSSTPVVLLEDPRHLGNVGAVVRVAAAAGAAGVMTTGPRDPWQPAAIRGSAGLHFSLPVTRVESTSSVARAARPVVAVDPDGDQVLGAAPIPAGAVLAFGTERHGLSEDLLGAAQMRVRIPMRPGVSSLNLATSVAIVLYSRAPA